MENPYITFRVWRNLSAATGMRGLYSLNAGWLWKRGENVAHCTRELSQCGCPECRKANQWMSQVHYVCVKTCTCGFYSATEPGVLWVNHQGIQIPDYLETGIIVAYGRLSVGEVRGWDGVYQVRSTHARPLALVNSGPSSRYRAEQYGMDLVPDTLALTRLAEQYRNRLNWHLRPSMSWMPLP